MSLSSQVCEYASMRCGGRTNVPRLPMVREELLFETGAPELVVQCDELCLLEGKNCSIRQPTRCQSSGTITKRHSLRELREQTLVQTKQIDSIKKPPPTFNSKEKRKFSSQSMEDRYLVPGLLHGQNLRPTE